MWDNYKSNPSTVVRVGFLPGATTCKSIALQPLDHSLPHNIIHFFNLFYVILFFFHFYVILLLFIWQRGLSFFL